MYTYDMTRDELLEATDEQIIDWMKEVGYLYGLHKVIRYDQTRPIGTGGESVSEHITALMILCEYFLELDDPQHTLERERIRNLILWHDIVEIETGDVPTCRKTKDHADDETQVIDQVLAHFPDHMKEIIKTTLVDYQNLTSPEARFVKALDKIECWFSILMIDGKEKIVDGAQTTHEQALAVIEKYDHFSRDYSCMNKVSRVFSTHLLETNWYRDKD